MERQTTRTMNHALTPQEVLDVLRISPLFSGLRPEEFKRIISLVEMKRIPPGTIFVEEASDNTDLYVLRRGRASARKSGIDGRRPIVRFHLPGDMLNEASFLTGCTTEFTLESIDDVEVWIIPADVFRNLIHELGDMDTRLGFSKVERPIDDEASSVTAVTVAAKMPFDNQRDGENLLWRGRRAQILFFTDAWLAWLLLVVTIVMTIAAALPGTAATFDSQPALIARIVTLIASFAVALWNFIDWRNDDYIVTDQRVIHRERVFLMFDQQDECPIDKIQNVNVRRRNWFSTTFDLGDITIETQGVRGNVSFSWVQHPDEVARIVLDHSGRARERRKSLEKAQMREALQKDLQQGEAPADDSTIDTPQPQPQTQTTSWFTHLYHWFVPPMRETRGADIVYHKHWLLLLQNTAVQLLAFLMCIVLLIIVPQLGWQLSFVQTVQTVQTVQSAQPTSLPLIAGLAIAFVLLAWLIWRYEDWRNDVYIVAPDRIIDYDRSPFGIAGTQQKTASMSSIQNVTYRTRGLLDNAFNMGDVVIRTGGQDGELVFERVWNPRRVQREIVDRLEDFQNRQQQSQQAAHRREIAEWLGAYDEIRTPNAGLQASKNEPQQMRSELKTRTRN